MILTEEQEFALKNVRTADERWRLAKVNAELRAKQIAAEEVAELSRIRDEKNRIAFDLGIPKIQISRDGLGTTAPVTLNESLSRTTPGDFVEAAPVEAGVPGLSRYSIDGNVLTVTLAGTELAAALTATEWQQNEAPGLDTADFIVITRKDHTHYLEPITATGLREQNFRQHPVVAWASKPANEAEAIAWMQS